MDGITEDAGREFKRMLEIAQATPERCVRLIMSDDGPALELSEKEPSDITFDYEGQTVLVVNPSLAAKTAGRRIDYREGRFRFA